MVIVIETPKVGSRIRLESPQAHVVCGNTFNQPVRD
jgi:hypothetical protein